MLYSKTISTPLGSMIAIADNYALHLLQFEDYKKLATQIAALEEDKGCKSINGNSAPLQLLEIELVNYFAGTLKQFTVPLKINGTTFQKTTWQALLNIPYGTITTYKTMAEIVERPYARRAVGTAHGANKIAILIPCHRVIATNGSLRGYASGPERKQWLLDFEEKNK